MSRRVTKEEFLQRCRQHYGDRYDYSHVEWIDTRHKILIVCPAHGPFEQFAYKHMRGHGCRRCALQRRFAADRTNFVRIEAAIHARFPQYELDRSTFRSARMPVEIRCSIHDHRFRIVPFRIIHKQSSGCPACLADSHQKRRRDQRHDPDAEQHLQRIATELSQRHAETYRCWLAGETLWEIARRHGVTAEAVRLWLKRVGEVLDASAVEHTE